MNEHLEKDPRLSFAPRLMESFNALAEHVSQQFDCDEETRLGWLAACNMITFGDKKTDQQSRRLSGSIIGSDEFAIEQFELDDVSGLYTLDLHLYEDGSPFVREEDLSAKTVLYRVIASLDIPPSLIHLGRVPKAVGPKQLLGWLSQNRQYVHQLTPIECQTIIAGLRQVFDDVDLESAAIIDIAETGETESLKLKGQDSRNSP